MKIQKFIVEAEIEEKILTKHGINREEFDNSLENGNRRTFRLKDNIYMAVTHYIRYITVIFDYEPPNAKVRTAYPSGMDEINRYNKK